MSPHESAVLDGVLVPAAAAAIPVTDEGLLRGDGVFEVIRVYNGRPFALERHLERLASSAAGLRLPLDVECFREDIALLLGSWSPVDALIRILATRGGHRIALAEALPDLPVTMALSSITYAPVRLLDGIKSLSYGANMLARRLALERGSDDALLVTPHGRVLECPTASFFLVTDGVVRTAPLSDHVLDSITRRLVIECVAVREEPIALTDLAHAEEYFVASSVREVVGVHAVDEVARTAPGPRTAEIETLVRARIDAELRG